MGRSARSEEIEEAIKPRRGASRRAIKEAPRAIKEKFVEARLQKVYTISAKTENQAKALEMMKNRQVVVLKGSSGTGKTFLACVQAANEYLKGKVKRIVLIRPYEQVGKSIGLRPGTGDEKLRPLMQSMLQTLERVFGKAELEAKINEGTIVLEALEDVRGRSYADAFVIVDELQNVDVKGVKALLTRLEDTSRLVGCGDGKQKDTKVESGIDWLAKVMDKVKKERPRYLNEDDLRQAYENFGVVEFNNDDIVRGGFTALMVKVFDEEQ